METFQNGQQVKSQGSNPEFGAGVPWAKPMCLVTGIVDALCELGVRKLINPRR